MRYARFSLLTLLLSAGANGAFAQGATQTVNMQVQSISALAFTGTVTLTLMTATPGVVGIHTDSADGGADSSPHHVVYAITNNAANQKMVGSINANMPATLLLSVYAPGTGVGTSAGVVDLSTGAVDVVTGIGAVSVSGRDMHFVLSAPAVTSPFSISRLVTFTIVAG